MARAGEARHEVQRGLELTVTAAALAGTSAGDLDRALASPAELRVSVTEDAAIAIALGAFDRRPPAVPENVTVVRRGSGGPPVQVGPGTVHLALSLEHPGALVPCDEKRIVNRYVRPLLRALTGVSTSQAHYFGRDWVSLAHRPVAWVGFAHDASTRRTLFEAFVAVRTPFALGTRASFLGHVPATVEEIRGHELEPGKLAEAVVAAYERAGKVTLAPARVGAVPAPAVDAVPWKATREEAIGIVGAGPDSRGVFRVGGEILVSRDAIGRLETRIADAAPTRGASEELGRIGRLVDETLAAPGVALEGVRSLVTVRDVIAEALALAAAAG
jgi:hypothetical protein